MKKILLLLVVISFVFLNVDAKDKSYFKVKVPIERKLPFAPQIPDLSYSPTVVSYYNLFITYDLDNVMLTVNWNVQPGYVWGAGKFPVQFGFSYQMVDAVDGGGVQIMDAIVAPNALTTLYFNNFKVTFIWPANNGQICTVVCQPGPNGTCP